MPNPVAKSYEITRKTVPEPDWSWRPSDAEEVAAFECFRVLDRDEQELFTRVTSALSGRGSDGMDVIADVEHDCVILRGQVRDSHVIVVLLEMVSRVDGVRVIVDHLVVSGD